MRRFRIKNTYIEDYEELCKDLRKKCINKIGEALKLTKLKKENIDEIILVDG